MKVWIIFLKGFGYIWLTAAVLLIFAGIAGTWMKGGFSAVQELLSPFNVANWIVTVITLALGFGALAWAEKLKAKGPVGFDKLAQLLQDDRAKASQSWEAMQKLVNNYGAILERRSGLIVSAELLPASKQEIKQALIAVARTARASGHISAEMMEHFRVGYASLADFVSHEEAEIMKRFNSLVQAGTEIKDPSDAHLLEIAEGLKDNRAIEIQQRSRDEFARLIQEFDAAVTA
jgi:hypothetical protein